MNDLANPPCPTAEQIQKDREWMRQMREWNERKAKWDRRSDEHGQEVEHDERRPSGYGRPY